MELGLYQHYKGKFYDVVDIAKHADTQEEMIVYCAMYGKFETLINSKKEFEKIVAVDGKNAPRFRFINTLEDDSDLGLLCVLNSESELKEVISLLKLDGVKHEVKREKFDPKPAHLESDLFLKVYVEEDEFEMALDLIHGSHNE